MFPTSHDDRCALHLESFSLGHIAHRYTGGVGLWPLLGYIHHSAAEPYARALARPIQIVVAHFSHAHVVHRLARHCAGDELAHEQAGHGGVAIGKVDGGSSLFLSPVLAAWQIAQHPFTSG